MRTPSLAVQEAARRLHDQHPANEAEAVKVARWMHPRATPEALAELARLAMNIGVPKEPPASNSHGITVRKLGKPRP